MGTKAVGARGATRATVTLTALSVPYTLHAYRHARSVASYGLEAAQALDVEASRVFKTLLADVDGDLTVAVVPVTAQLDLKALAATHGGKRAAMAEARIAERASGYVVGGISPIGQRQRHPTVVDASVLGWPTVYVSGGRRGLEIELAPSALIMVTEALAAPIAR
jgi:Cys-tRNA(Pro)/Cys-tRNA(Cys) deacylase